MELNEKAKDEIEEILAKVARKAKQNIYKGHLYILKDAATKAIELLKGLVPPCYLVFLYDELTEAIGPTFQLHPCVSFATDGQCGKGLNQDACGDCPEYKPDPVRLGAGIDCDDCPFPEKEECEK